MFCTKCGAVVPDNSKFCTKCGAVISRGGEPDSPAEDPARSPRQEYPAPVRDDEASGSPRTAGQTDGTNRYAGNTRQWTGANRYDGTARQETGSNRHAGNDRQGTDTAAEEKPRKKRTGLVVGIIAAVVVVAAAAAAFFMVRDGGGTTVNLDRYLTISEHGFDGYGTASFKIDTEKLEDDYAGRIKMSSDAGSYSLIFSDTDDSEDPVTVLIDGIGGSLDRDSGLSNGDIIHFTWSVDSGLEGVLDVSLKYTDTDHTVKDLGKMTTYDVFDDVYMSYEGTAPDGTAALHVNPGSLLPLTADDFIVSKTTGLSEGDVLEVTLLDRTDDTLAEAGYIAESRSREYTVEGLAHYASSLSEFPDDVLEHLRAKSENEDHSGYGVGDDSVIDQITFLGYYFLNSRFDDGNKLYLVYRNAITTTYGGESKTMDQFTYVCYPDGIVNADGTFTISEDDWSVPEYEEDPLVGGVTGEGFSYEVGGMEFYCNGFQTLGELYETEIAQQLNLYTVESTVGEQEMD